MDIATTAGTQAIGTVTPTRGVAFEMPSAVAEATASVIDETRLLQALPLVAVRLQERHPAASPALVQRSIGDAIRVFSEARVRLYLPILIERRASEALREATSPASGSSP